MWAINLIVMKSLYILLGTDAGTQWALMAFAVGVPVPRWGKETPVEHVPGEELCLARTDVSGSS